MTIATLTFGGMEKVARSLETALQAVSLLTCLVLQSARRAGNAAGRARGERPTCLETSLSSVAAMARAAAATETARAISSPPVDAMARRPNLEAAARAMRPLPMEAVMRMRGLLAADGCGGAATAAWDGCGSSGCGRWNQ